MIRRLSSVLLAIPLLAAGCLGGDDGTPTPALLKKLAALGADESVLPRLQRKLDGKAETLFLDTTVPGVTLRDALQKALEEALAKLPIPKVMQYQLQDGWSTVNFVRPAHRLVALHGADIVDVGVLGLKAGRTTQGHRFEAAKPLLEIRDADSYAGQLLEEGAVIASFEKRREEIEAQLEDKAQGLAPIEDEAFALALRLPEHWFDERVDNAQASRSDGKFGTVYRRDRNYRDAERSL